MEIYRQADSLGPERWAEFEDPAVAEGYTRISDQIIDKWMPRLSGARFKIVMYIARRTYGFGKNSDAVSISQMVDGIKKADGTVLDEGTGLSRSTVIAECAWLASRENGSVLHKVSEKENGHHKTNRWALNLGVIIGKDGKGSAKSAGSGRRGSPIIRPPSSDNRTHNKQLNNKQFPPLQKANLLHPPKGEDEETSRDRKPRSGADLVRRVESGELDFLELDGEQMDLYEEAIEQIEKRGARATSSRGAFPTQPKERQRGVGKDRSPRRRDRSRSGTPEWTPTRTE